jgi:hypothetical protein
MPAVAVGRYETTTDDDDVDGERRDSGGREQRREQRDDERDERREEMREGDCGATPSTHCWRERKHRWTESMTH